MIQENKLKKEEAAALIKKLSYYPSIQYHKTNV